MTVQSVQQFRRRPELNPENETAKATQLKGAQTYCIINEATPSGTVAMDYFS